MFYTFCLNDLVLFIFDLAVEVAEKKQLLNDLNTEHTDLLQDLDEINTQYQKLKVLLQQKGYARKRRENIPTDEKMIGSRCSSTRFRRREETKNVLEYIHGGENASVYGCWDYLCSIASVEKIEQLVMSFKRGRFIETVINNVTSASEKSDAAMKKAVTTKYLSHLSRRKYNMICRIQKHSFEGEGSSVVSYGERNINLKTVSVSHSLVDKFVKSLDIGDVTLIPGYSGVSRTITGLITMITNLHNSVDNLKTKLRWFKGNKNHYVVEFSDDGAPESRDETMTIGTLSFWNFGQRIRSREFHYPLHMLTAGEKDDVCKDLWRQHSEEMLLIEGNVFEFQGEKSTFEFVPAADIAWLVTATNCLPCSSRYPVPFANVHKEQLTMCNGTISYTTDTTWQIPKMEKRRHEMKLVEKFKKNLPASSSEAANHKKLLDYMAANGLRQLGEPVIGDLADRIMPEPLHLEINNWQQVLGKCSVLKIRVF